MSSAVSTGDSAKASAGSDGAHITSSGIAAGGIPAQQTSNPSHQASTDGSSESGSVADASSNAPAGPTGPSRRVAPTLRPSSPLHAAVEGGDEAAVAHLLAGGATPNSRDSEGRTPLKLAASRAQVAIARLLLRHGALLGDGDEEDESQTPLHAAARQDATMVHTLLQAGCNPNATDKVGLTPLHDAACEGRADAAKLLIEAGALPAVGDRHGKTALHYAAESGYIEVIDVLIEATAGDNITSLGEALRLASTLSALHAARPSGESSGGGGARVVSNAVADADVDPRGGESAGSHPHAVAGEAAVFSSHHRSDTALDSLTDSEDEDCCSDHTSTSGRAPEDHNIDVCMRCGDYGELLICENCPRSFHLECLGLESLPPEDPWYCGECHLPLPEPFHRMLRQRPEESAAAQLVHPPPQNNPGSTAPSSGGDSRDDLSYLGEDELDELELSMAAGTVHPAIIEKMGGSTASPHWADLLEALASELGMTAGQFRKLAEADGAFLEEEETGADGRQNNGVMSMMAAIAGHEAELMASIAKLALQQPEVGAKTLSDENVVAKLLKDKLMADATQSVDQQQRSLRAFRNVALARPQVKPRPAIDVNGKDTNGRTPLYYAVVKGRIHAVKSLLAAGADIHVVTDDGKSLLHHAALNGQAGMVNALLSLGMNVNCRDRTGQTPLYCAAEKGHLAASKALIAAGADVDAHDDGDNGVTPLRRAAACGHIAIIEVLVNAKATLDWASNTGNNALHDAAWNGRCDAIRALISAGANIHARDNHNWTALHYAADHGRAEAMQTLIGLGADPNAKSRDRWTPLRLAAKGSHIEAVKVLLQAKANFLMDDEEENYKQSPLHAAARLRDAVERNATVKTLIEAGADLSAKDKEGWTPVHCAAANGHADTLKALIAAGANVDAIDNHGLSPLREAAAAGHSAAVEALIQANADVNAKCKQGYTPLHDAAWQGRAEAVTLLLTAGAEARVKAIDGRTPLHCAAQRGHKEVVELLVPQCKGDVSAHDRDGWTPMHKAAQEGHSEVVAALAAAHADVNAVHIYSSTPLHEATQKGDTATTAVLLANGADVHAVDHLGQTPLHTAAANVKKTVGVVLQLLVHAASCFTKTVDGSTPLHLAAKAGNFDAVELLIRWGADPNARDSERRTPSDVSQGAAVKKLLRLLKPAGTGTNGGSNPGATLSSAVDVRAIINKQSEYIASLRAVTRDGELAAESAKKTKKTTSTNPRAFLTTFSFGEVLEATDYFNSKVAGKGMYGTLFECKLRGVDVVVKRIQIDPDAMTTAPAISLGAHLHAEVNLCHSMRELARVADLPASAFEFGTEMNFPPPPSLADEIAASKADGAVKERKGAPGAAPEAPANPVSLLAARSDLASMLNAGFGNELSSLMHSCRKLVGYALLPKSSSRADSSDRSSLLLALVYAVPKWSSLRDWAFMDRQAVEVEVEMASQAAELAAQEAEKELLAADEKQVKKAKKKPASKKPPASTSVETPEPPKVVSVSPAAAPTKATKEVAVTTALPAPKAVPTSSVTNSPVPKGKASKKTGKGADTSKGTSTAPLAADGSAVSGEDTKDVRDIQIPRSRAEEEALLEAAIRESLNAKPDAPAAESWVPVATHRRAKKPTNSTTSTVDAALPPVNSIPVAARRTAATVVPAPPSAPLPTAAPAASRNATPSPSPVAPISSSPAVKPANQQHPKAQVVKKSAWAPPKDAQITLLKPPVPTASANPEPSRAVPSAPHATVPASTMKPVKSIFSATSAEFNPSWMPSNSVEAAPEIESQRTSQVEASSAVWNAGDASADVAPLPVADRESHRHHFSDGLLQPPPSADLSAPTDGQNLLGSPFTGVLGSSLYPSPLSGSSLSGLGVSGTTNSSATFGLPTGGSFLPSFGLQPFASPPSNLAPLHAPSMDPLMGGLRVARGDDGLGGVRLMAGADSDLGIGYNLRSGAEPFMPAGLIPMSSSVSGSQQSFMQSAPAHAGSSLFMPSSVHSLAPIYAPRKTAPSHSSVSSVPLAPFGLAAAEQEEVETDASLHHLVTSLVD